MEPKAKLFAKCLLAITTLLVVTSAQANICLFNCDTPVDVPEPGTIALMGIGLAGLAIARKKRK